MSATEIRDLTCEEAFAELDRIVAALEGASVEQTKEHLRHGRAIERTLRTYLDQTEAELKDIEAGENLPQYRITAVSKGQIAVTTAPSTVEPSEPVGASDADFSSLADFSSSPADDDIPF